MRSRFVRWAAGLLLALAPAARAEAGKNIVLVVADDMGAEIGCYGGPIQTPNLDRLASQGTRFTRAFATTASCSPSRSVILTGLHNHANGQYGLQHGPYNFQTFARLKSLPVLLSEAGYRTASIGKIHVAPEPVYHFDQAIPHKTPGGAHNPVGMANDARGFLAEASDRPFFLYFCPTDPHRAGEGFANLPVRPGVEPVVYDPAKLPVPPYLPDTPEARAEWADFAQAVSRFDQGVGRLMEVLEETGHADDTLIVVVSDNGPPFPGAKTTLYEPGIRLPLIVRAPGHPAPGSARDAMVSFVDLAPTILDFAGAPGPKYELHGRSFLPLLGHEDAEGRDHVFASHTFHEVQMYYPMRALREGRFKLIFNIAHPLPFPFASDLHGSATWQGVLERGDEAYGPRTVEAYLHRPRFELYDLEADPLEARNLADDPAHADRLAAMKARLRAFQEETGDPWALKWDRE